MSLLIDIAHLIVAAALSFLGLGYEREEPAQAVQLVPHLVKTEAGAMLTPASFSVSLQNAQSLCQPGLVLSPRTDRTATPLASSASPVIILNDCETLSSGRALPAL